MVKKSQRRRPARSQSVPSRRLVHLFSSDTSIAVGLTLLAWIHRLFFLLSNRDRFWPLTIFYEGDSETFFRHARALINNQFYDGGMPFHPPGFPMFLSVIHRMVGAGPGASEIPHLAIKILLALVTSCSVGLLFLLVKSFLGRNIALVTCLMVVYHFGLIVIAVAPVSEGLYLTILVAALLIWSRLLPPPLGLGVALAFPKIEPVILGTLLGAIALTRAEGLLLVTLLVAVGLGTLIAKGLSRRALAPWAVVVGVCLLVVCPWTVRNWRHMNDVNQRLKPVLAESLPTFVPVTLYGPLNFGLANRSGADGTFSPENLDRGSGRLDVTEPETLELLLHGDEMAWRWIRENPGDFLRLTLNRWRLSGEAFKLGFSQWNWPGGLAGTRRPVDIFVPNHSFLGWVLPIMVFAGIVLCLRCANGRRWLVVVVIPTFIWLLTTGLFYGYARLAVIVLPLWLSLVAVVLATVASFLPERLGRFGPAALLVSVLVLVIAEALGATSDRNYRASASTVDGHHLNRDATMVIEVISP